MTSGTSGTTTTTTCTAASAALAAATSACTTPTSLSDPRSTSVAELRRKAQEHSAALLHSLHAAAAAGLAFPGLHLPPLSLHTALSNARKTSDFINDLSMHHSHNFHNNNNNSIHNNNNEPTAQINGTGSGGGSGNDKNNSD